MSFYSVLWQDIVLHGKVNKHLSLPFIYKGITGKSLKKNTFIMKFGIKRLNENITFIAFLWYFRLSEITLTSHTSVI